MSQPGPTRVSAGVLGGARGLGGDVRGVLAIPTFRRLWAALCFASLGDWLGLLALTAYAQALSAGSYQQENLAVALVFLLRLAPAMVIGPLAGVVADRFDRRWTMVAANAFRFVVIATIPLVGRLWWLFAATLLVESASLFFIPAKEATVPNLVPRSRLEAANQLNLAGTYGSAPVAAAVFVGLSLLVKLAGGTPEQLALRPATAALWVNALTFLVAALVIARLRDIPAHPARDEEDPPSAWRTLVEGWRYLGSTELVRGLVFAMLGAFAAAGAVIGLARTYVRDLGAGDAGYGLLFFAVFLGLASGMFFGPRLLRDFSRRRLLCCSIVLAGVCLALIALAPSIVLAVVLTVLLGAFAGTSWVVAYTLVGLEVDDEHRGRVFASLNVMLRVVLVGVLALAPLLAAAIGKHQVSPGDWTWTLSGAAITMLIAGVLAAVLGVVSFRAMDDRPGVPLIADILAAVHGRPIPGSGDAPTGGFFLVFEGGEGAGKSTQVAAVAAWIRSRGHEVVTSREPGGTPAGLRIRELVLDPGTGALVPEAEALLYAADRAQHVATVIRPALERGAIVVADRYVDSSLAYQGAGRALQVEDVARLSRWATHDLVPDLTVLLDLPAELGAERRAARDGGPGDRVEAEPGEFHHRVRAGFLERAADAPHRYLVLEANQPPEKLTELVAARLQTVLPWSPHELAEQEQARREQAARLAEQRRVEEEQRAAAERVRREEQTRLREEQERAEQHRIEQHRIEQDRVEQDRVEQDRIEQDRIEQDRIERLRIERQRAGLRSQPGPVARTAEPTVAQGGREHAEPALVTRELSLVDELFGPRDPDEPATSPGPDPKTERPGRR